MKNPGMPFGPGTLREFQFPEYADLRGCVKQAQCVAWRYGAGGGAPNTAHNGSASPGGSSRTLPSLTMRVATTSS